MDGGSARRAEAGIAASGNWMAHIEDVYLGRWVNPQTGESAPRSSCERILIADTLEGVEAGLAREAGIEGAVAVVADPDTWDAMGGRVAAALAGAGDAPTEILLDPRPRATLKEAEALAARLERFDSVVAVGSGTVNDLVKHVVAQDGRSCCVFGTAPSMDGYVSSTASMGLPSGLKTSLPSRAPNGVFLDLEVLASAPPGMAAAGFGDALCASVARVDWWMSHRLLGTFYDDAPYLVAAPDAGEMETRAEGVGAREREAVGWLTRALILSGLGVGFTGVSNHGSMAEHQISHYIDCFARERHPGSLHGQQVGVATLTMARIQGWFLAQERPPELRPTRVDPEGMARRMGPEIARQCEEEYRRKALDAEGAAALNERLQEIWPSLREELRVWHEPAERLSGLLAEAGGATTAEELGVPADLYREAVRRGHEMRNRFTFADLACDAGLLDDFAAEEAR